MEVYEVVQKLIGKIEPYGDTNIDEMRVENLKEYINLTHLLIADLIEIAKYKDRYEYSIKILGTDAYKELLEIREIIDGELAS
jgi:hypothetical protein